MSAWAVGGKGHLHTTDCHSTMDYVQVRPQQRGDLMEEQRKW